MTGEAPQGDYAVVRVDEMESTFGGMAKRARIALGVKSFAMMVVDLPPDSDEMFPEHSHEEDGSEEVYWLLSGSGLLVIDGTEFPIEPGVAARVGPAPRRRLRSGPQGARVLMLAGVPGQTFVADDEAERAHGPDDFEEGSTSMQSSGERA